MSISIEQVALEEILRLAEALQWTDIHVTAGDPVTYRAQDTILYKCDVDSLNAFCDGAGFSGMSSAQLLSEGMDTAQFYRFFRSVSELCYFDMARAVQQDITDEENNAINQKMLTAKQKGTIDSSFSYGNSRFRVKFGASSSGRRNFIRLRRQPIHPIEFEEIVRKDRDDASQSKARLGMESILGGSAGLTLISARMGQGKTTFINSVLDKINRQRAESIVTIENPIEYVHQSQKSDIVQKEVGNDVASFLDGAIQMKREDVTVGVVAESLGREEKIATLEIAEIGILAMTSLHSGDTVTALQNFVAGCSGGDPNAKQAYQERLATTIQTVISLRRLPSATGEGAQMIYEVLPITDTIRNLIDRGAFNEISNELNNSGKSLSHDAAEKVIEGRIKWQDALHNVTNKSIFLDELAKSRDSFTREDFELIEEARNLLSWK